MIIGSLVVDSFAVVNFVDSSYVPDSFHVGMVVGVAGCFLF